MFIIGITGPSGAGKGAVSEYLNSVHGFKVIDADKVYHEIISSPSECVSELVDNFGEGILNDNGGILRSSLSLLVFGEENKDKLLLLNKITHKYVISEIKKRIEDYSREGVGVAVIDAPLLIESGLNDMCDYVMAVVADKSLRADRIAKRDGIDRDAALLRINSQKPDSFYEEKCDCLLGNNQDIKSLGKFVDQCLQIRSIIE